MTARELYECDPGFRGFLAKWDEDRRCPFPLEDYLRDRDMHSQADCAKWATEEKDRPVYHPNKEIERGGLCGPYPTTHYAIGSNVQWFWAPGTRNASNFPDGRVEDYQKKVIERPGPIDAIIGLMDAWVPLEEPEA